MSYRVSRARKSFELQLQQANQEISTILPYTSKAGHTSKVLAAFYILIYSQLEVYIKNSIEDCIDTINKLQPPIDSWPESMLGFLLHTTEQVGDTYTKYSQNSNEGAVIEKLGFVAKSIRSWGNQLHTNSRLNSGSILNKKKYPSPKNLPGLYKRIGINDIWATLGRAGKLNGKLTLTSLNDLRTSIVHGGIVPPGFGQTDFRDRTNDMKRFVAALDRGVSAHFCSKFIRRSDWNREMGMIRGHTKNVLSGF